MAVEIISAEKAKEIMDSRAGIVILDVREEDEYLDGHIKNAIQLSYTKINEEAANILKDKNQEILVYCRSGRRSYIGANYLDRLGYTNIKDFGGILDWPYEIEK